MTPDIVNDILMGCICFFVVAFGLVVLSGCYKNDKELKDKD